MKIEIPSHIDATWLVAVVAAFVIAFIIVRKEPQRESERLRKEMEGLREEVERLREVSQNDLRKEIEALRDVIMGISGPNANVTPPEGTGERLYDAAENGKVTEVSIIT